MRKFSEKMREFDFLKKVANLGVIDGLGAVPLAKVLPPRTDIGQTTRDGTQEEEEIEITEDTPTQTPSTAATQVPVTNAPAPPSVNVTIGQPRIQGFRSNTEGIIVRNIESDSDQEEEPEKHQSLGEEKEQDEAKDLLNERLVLTPQDQEDLFKDIVVGQGGTQVEAHKEEITFNEACQ